MKPPQTPEEAKWMASVLDPEKAKRRLKYVYALLAIWIVIAIGWSITLIHWLIAGEAFSISDGFTCVILVLGSINTISAVINTRRIAEGRYPKGF